MPDAHLQGAEAETIRVRITPVALDSNIHSDPFDSEKEKPEMGRRKPEIGANMLVNDAAVVLMLACRDID